MELHACVVSSKNIFPVYTSPGQRHYSIQTSADSIQKCFVSLKRCTVETALQTWRRRYAMPTMQRVVYVLKMWGWLSLPQFLCRFGAPWPSSLTRISWCCLWKILTICLSQELWHGTKKGLVYCFQTVFRYQMVLGERSLLHILEPAQSYINVYGSKSRAHLGPALGTGSDSLKFPLQFYLE